MESTQIKLDSITTEIIELHKEKAYYELIGLWNLAKDVGRKIDKCLDEVSSCNDCG